MYAFAEYMWSVVNKNQPRPFLIITMAQPYHELFEACRLSDPGLRPSMEEVVHALQAIGNAS